jgi:hypothetical protein
MLDRLKVVARPASPLQEAAGFSISHGSSLGFPRLSELELHKVTMNSQSLVHIVELKQLRTLKCIQVEFADVGRLRSASNGSIDALLVSDCRFVSSRGYGRASASIRGMKSFLGFFTGVKKLALERMELTDDMLGSYVSTLAGPTSLNLAGVSRVLAQGSRAAAWE